MPPLTELQQRRVCQCVVEGRLHREAGNNGLPTIERIHQALEDEPGFKAAFDRARELWAYRLIETIPDITSQVTPVEETRDTTYRDIEGNVSYSAHTIISKDNVARARLRLDGIQFMVRTIHPLGAQIQDMNRKPKIIEGMVNDLPLSDDDAAAIKVLPPARA